ncbi:MAG: zinc ribbon domain-containing protein [Treponema sp.]|jgi:hypothetical protein|nr:zinc ribbon domain-containing protein [Treponema sp.]
MKRKKKAQKKQIRFFCDKCGFEVPQDAKVCPDCGCSFSSVKCPACGFIGQVASFQDGCPVCGYSTEQIENAQTKMAQSASIQAAQSAQSFETVTSGQETSASVDISRIIRKVRRSIQYTELPLWIYIITSIALIVSMLALYFNVR